MGLFLSCWRFCWWSCFNCFWSITCAVIKRYVEQSDSVDWRLRSGLLGEDWSVFSTPFSLEISTHVWVLDVFGRGLPVGWWNLIFENLTFKSWVCQGFSTWWECWCSLDISQGNEFRGFSRIVSRDLCKGILGTLFIFSIWVNAEKDLIRVFRVKLVIGGFFYFFEEFSYCVVR